MTNATHDDLLALIHEYRGLCETGEDRARRHGLGAVVGDVVPWEMEASVHAYVGHSVRFTTCGTFARGEVRRLNGAGMTLASEWAPAVGDSMLVRVSSRDGASTYVFPCRVAWVRPARMTTFGVELDGSSERSVAPAELVWEGALLARPVRARAMTS